MHERVLASAQRLVCDGDRNRKGLLPRRGAAVHRESLPLLALQLLRRGVMGRKGAAPCMPPLLYHSPALSYSGKGYLATARALADGEELSRPLWRIGSLPAPPAAIATEACPIGLRPAQLVKAMRADLVDHGLARTAPSRSQATSPALAIRMACPPLSVAHGPARFRLSPAPRRNFYICPAAPLATANRPKRAPRWPC